MMTKEKSKILGFVKEKNEEVKNAPYMILAFWCLLICCCCKKKSEEKT